MTEDARYIHLSLQAPLPRLDSAARKVILVAEALASEDWRTAVADWLIGIGCLYCIAWGEGCEAWHDSVDQANIGSSAGSAIPSHAFVMTTWHAQESLADAMWFAIACAEHPSENLVETLVVHIAEHARAAELIALFRKVRDGEDGSGTNA